MQLNFGYLDIILLIIAIVLVIRCIIRGFVAEFSSIAAVTLGVLLAVLLAKPVALFLDDKFGAAVWHPIAAFLGIFIIAYVVVKIIENALHSVFEKMHLQKLDKVLGFFYGILEGLLVISIVLMAMNWLSAIEFLNIQPILEQSFFAKLLLPLITSTEKSIAFQ